MRVRIFTRKGWYHVETARGKSMSLHTKDYNEAVETVKKLDIKKPPCPYCGSSSVPSHKKYCSSICRERYNNEMEHFGFMRSTILSAFNNECAVCKSKENLHIHHVDGQGLTIKRNRRNNDGNNLIVLCLVCHIRIHNKKREFASEDDIKLVSEYFPEKIDKFLERVKTYTELRNACKMPLPFPADYLRIPKKMTEFEHK